MKKVYISVVMLFMIFMLALPFITAEKNVDFVTLQENMKNFVKQDIMQEQSEEIVKKNYKIKEDLYESFMSYGPISYMNVEEITIFKQSDKQKRQQLLEKVESHIDSQIKSFEGYGIEQTEMLKKAMVIQKQEYIICVVLPDIDAVETCLNDIF